MSVNETVGARESSLLKNESFRSSQLESLRRRIADSSFGNVNSNGLDDPFAEIFAKTAAPDAPVAPEEASAPEPSQDDDSEVKSETTTQESSDSQDESQPAVEIAPVKTAEAILSTDVEQVEVAAEVVSEVEVAVNENLDNLGTDTGEPTEEIAIETVDLEAVEVEEDESFDVAADITFQAEVATTDAVVDQEVAAVPLQSNRRDRGEVEAEAEIQATTTTANTETESSEEQLKQTDERSAPAVAEAKEGVDRRRYSKGQDEASSRKESETQVDASNETRSPNARGPESRSSQGASSGTGIDVSSLTPVSSSASAGVPTNALIGAASPIAATAAAAAAKTGGASNSSATSSVTASTEGNDSTAPVSSSSNNQRTSPDGPAQAKANGTDTLSAVQRAKLVQRVSRGFQQLGSNGGQIRMRLAPDELGSVQLQMKLQNGELSGTMVTQTEAAAQALREQLPQLRSSLENQGIRLDRMDIQTEAAADAQDASTSGEPFGDASGQSGRGFEQRGQFANQRERSSWSDVRATPTQAPNDAPETAPRSVSLATAGAVDIKA